MSVYVDDAVHPYRGMIMCHMVADSIEELHEMADKIGVDRRHYQGPPVSSRPHYDICKSKRKLAIQYGAIKVDSKKIVSVIKNLMNKGIAA